MTPSSEGLISNALGMMPGAHGKGFPVMMKLTKANWPITPSSIVFRGAIGEYVQDISRDSESDPYAVLAQCLIMFGNRVGRTAYFQVGSGKHYANEFLLLVGTTSGGRKGTSASDAQALFDGPIDDSLTLETKGGLSSSEGLIWAVRDAGGEDEGVNDKRLLVIESEFSNTLKQSQRSGNTLSELIRQAWDSGRLGTMTKNNPTVATGAHVSIIGHITPSDVQEHFSRTDMANGFGNRFLWLATKRSKLNCNPPPITWNKCRRYRDDLLDALEIASQIREVKRTDEAQELWKQQYPFLEEEREGLVGELLARGSAHVIRLSLIYALAEGKNFIGVEHLRAALELWRYSRRCIEYLFPRTTGNPLADKVLAIINDKPGCTRTILHQSLGNNYQKERLDHAIETLLAVNWIERTVSATNSTEVFYSVPW